MTRARNAVPILLALALAPVAGCNLEGSGGSLTEATHVDRVFSGYVVDGAGGALEGVTVASSDGELSTTTNASGQYVLLMPVYDGRVEMNLSFTKDGYYRNNAAIPMIDDTSHYTSLVTLKVQVEPQLIDVEAGGRVAFSDNQLIMEFPPAGFTDEAGNAITGEVEVYAELIEPETLSVGAMPVPSMEAWDPAQPGEPGLLASQGMFILEANQNGEPVWPAGGTSFRVTIMGMERFVREDLIGEELTDEDLEAIDDAFLRPGDAIPLWTMEQSESIWDFGDGWWVVEEVDEDGNIVPSTAKGTQAAGDDNTLYAIVTDIPVGAASGSPPPQIPRYNCDARPRLSCVTGVIDAEGLWYDDSYDSRDEDLETRPIAGAYVGFEGIGPADNCSQCTCEETRVVEVCEDTDDDGDEECRNENQTVVTNVRPNNSGFGDVCSGTTQQACACTDWTTINVRYQGGAYTDSAGKYCANVGSGGRISEATVLKDWLITETDPQSGEKSSYAVAYEHHEKPRIQGLKPRTMCEDGTSQCGTYNHTMPCEWFFYNDACAVVGGCEVHHLRDFDEEDHISYYEDDAEYPY